MKINEKGLTIYIPDSAERHPDTPRYKHRFTINSETSNSKYMISYDSAQEAGYWTCSCRGNIRHGGCKHLNSLGLMTRKDVLTRRLR